MTQEHTLTVARTARYYTLGGTPPADTLPVDNPPAGLAEKVRRVWFVLHGFGQLAQYFIRRFDVVADEETLVVAPEGLSRAYLNGEYSKIGASWITREARDQEIMDYVAYLNQLYDTILAGRDPRTLHITLLGFSQGAATACRWLDGGGQTPGHIRVDRLILWAGFFANGLTDLIDLDKLRDLPVQYVYGEQDPFLTQLPEPAGYLRRLQTELPVLEPVAFDGGHTIERDVLRQLLYRP